jgi:hypothetical protein
MGVRDSRADTVDEACTTPREEQFILSAQPHGSPGALRQ